MQTAWKNIAYWLVLHGLLSLLFYTVQDHLPRHRNSYSGLGPPIPIFRQENASIDFPTGWSDVGSSSFKISSSQICLVCIKLIETN